MIAVVRKYVLGFAVLALAAGMHGCMKPEAIEEERFDWGGLPPGGGVFVVNEGNFMYGNASLSFYMPGTGKVENEVAARANSMKLGDVAQSMTIHDSRGYIAVNNSGIVFVIDINTCVVTGIIKGLVSPRYVHIAGGNKGYITDLYSPHITVFDPATLKITGRIDTGGHKSTEQMTQYGDYLFVNCWSYDDRILVIDTRTDSVAGEIVVGMQPVSIAIDKNGKLWALTDGGRSSGQSKEPPALYRIDAATRTIEKQWTLPADRAARRLCLNGGGDELYFISESVWRMPVDAEELPDVPFIVSPQNRPAIFYGLGVNPYNSEIYVADAIDYMQAGVVYRYSPEGELLDTFRTGIIPGGFCFR